MERNGEGRSRTGGRFTGPGNLYYDTRSGAARFDSGRHLIHRRWGGPASRPSRTVGVSVVIPMSCPNCGRHGNVPNDRLNTRLHCKKCDAVFHLDLSGKVVLGEPGGTGKNKPKAVVEKGEFDPIGDLAESIMRIPKAVRYAIGVIAAVGLVGFALASSGVFKSRPETLETRANDLATAFIAKDVSTIKRMALPGTQSDVDSWMSKTRGMFGDYANDDSSGRVIVMATPRNTNKGAGTSNVELFLQAPPSADGKLESLYLTTVWKEDAGRWKFDPTNSIPLGAKRPEDAFPKKR